MRNHLLPVVGLLVLAVAAVFGVRAMVWRGTPAPSVAAHPGTTQAARLVMLTAEGCPPCARMKPVLQALESEYAGTLRTEEIDINLDRAAADRYGAEYTPTLVFLDRGGNEVARRVGFTAKNAVVATFAKHGVAL
jgi:thioredoxin 1